VLISPSFSTATIPRRGAIARWKHPIAYHFLLAATAALYIIAHVKFMLLLVLKPVPLATVRISDAAVHSLRLNDFLPPAKRKQRTQRARTGATPLSSDLNSRDAGPLLPADADEKVSSSNGHCSMALAGCACETKHRVLDCISAHPRYPWAAEGRR
jgi:hypothetical protein